MHHRQQAVRSRSLLLQLLDRLIGRGDILIAPPEPLPLILASYPRGRSRFARSLSAALRITWPSLPASLRASYAEIFDRAPSLVVVELRRRNACGCLGHHHPSLAQSALARRLAAETSGEVGEIDLAVEAIRSWAPLPLSSLAAEQYVPPADAECRRSYARLRFHVALLSVFLHELEHVAFPERPEHEVRRHSDELYQQSLRHQLAEEFGASFGIDSVDEPARV